MAHRIHEDSETTKQIESSGRAAEDLKMFSRMWPGWIARRLAKMYAEATPPMILRKRKSPDFAAGRTGGGRRWVSALWQWNLCFEEMRKQMFSDGCSRMIAGSGRKADTVCCYPERVRERKLSLPPGISPGRYEARVGGYESCR